MFTTINVYGAVKFPEGGITTLDFKVSRFIGLSGIMLLTSLLNKSVAKGRDFTIASTSISKVHNDLSFRLTEKNGDFVIFSDFNRI